MATALAGKTNDIIEGNKPGLTSKDFQKRVNSTVDKERFEGRVEEIMSASLTRNGGLKRKGGLVQEGNKKNLMTGRVIF